jgi:predicted nucleic acid-binding protein
MAVIPNTEVFLDSAYVIALAQSTDAYHSRALAISEQLGSNRIFIITTRAVLLEVGNALSKIKSREAGIQLVNMLANSQTVEIVPLTEELAAQGWELFCQRKDKDWSWTDCISFVVMQERGLKQALTSDSHFEQAGFIALLRQ